RIDREHDPAEDLAVHYADAELGIPWPGDIGPVSVKDQGAGSWPDLSHLLASRAA
ncbi:MAG: dTDP-4-dehydrorhamnose 3,5-epimerase, partial [Pseudonocardiales bacterium]|nr:dTDP-4-dehydrorhamnose 3,5-epimerase [Pseudonocardia sp.]MDT7650332.1 dTDP-4-dehydrorhamnose 3,5-epimerase [Pseudonocardiales bacterium]